MTQRFTKIGAAGQPLPADAAEWAAVLDEQSGLMWTAGEDKPMVWKKTGAYATKLQIAGFTDWRVPTRAELILLVDDTKFLPAIDTTYFPNSKSDRYWSSTPAASSPGGCAWYVDFDDGYSDYDDQSGEGLVRAVRARQ